MFKALFTTIITGFTIIEATAQQKITLAEVNQHIGDSVTVCGKIYGGKFLDAAKNQPTFLNIGAAYPDQLLTIVIWSNTRKQFAYKPEENLKGKMVCVTGRIEMFKEKPQVTIHHSEQLQEQ